MEDNIDPAAYISRLPPRFNWLLDCLYADNGAHCTQAQAVEFAVLCAESVLPVLERIKPNELLPRKAIESARNWLLNPTDELAKKASKVCLECTYVTDSLTYNKKHIPAAMASMSASYAAAAAGTASCSLVYAELAYTCARRVTDDTVSFSVLIEKLNRLSVSGELGI